MAQGSVTCVKSLDKNGGFWGIGQVDYPDFRVKNIDTDGAGVRHELWRTPPCFNCLKAITYFLPSNDLTTGKKSTVRVRLRTGGKRRLRGWLPPAYGRAV